MSGITPPELAGAMDSEVPEGTDTTDLPGEPDGPPAADAPAPEIPDDPGSGQQESPAPGRDEPDLPDRD